MTEDIVTSARGRLGQSPYSTVRDIDRVCLDGVATLRGCLPSHYLDQVAQEAVAGIDEITAVVNDIEVMAPGDSDAANRGGGPAMQDLSRGVVIANALGLHLRAAAQFVRLAQQFKADVRVHFDGREVDGKSILDLTTLAAACGSRLDLGASGADAAEALSALCKLIKSRFDEEVDEAGVKSCDSGSRSFSPGRPP